MPDREKVIQLLMLARENMCLNCTYDDLVDDAITLLKAQEPVKPIRKVIGYGWRYFCGKCGNSIVSQQHFCQECGQAVKWE